MKKNLNNLLNNNEFNLLLNVMNFFIKCDILVLLHIFITLLNKIEIKQRPSNVI